METTVVIFRVDREGITFALFPELPADNDGIFCDCFQHVGQHSAADYHGCIAYSRPATPDEYADLADELRQRGYVLDVRQRAMPVLHDHRRQVAMAW